MEKSISTWSRAAHIAQVAGTRTPTESMVASYHVGFGKKRTANLTVYGGTNTHDIKHFLAIQTNCHAFWINRVKIRPFTKLKGIAADFDGDDYGTTTMPYCYEVSCVVSWFPFERKTLTLGSTSPLTGDRLKQRLADSLKIPVEKVRWFKYANIAV